MAEIAEKMLNKVVQSKPHSNRFMQQLLEILTKSTSKVSSNAELWGVFARYYSCLNDVDMVFDCRQKQIRATRVTGWHTDEEKFKVWC